MSIRFVDFAVSHFPAENGGPSSGMDKLVIKPAECASLEAQMWAD